MQKYTSGAQPALMPLARWLEAHPGTAEAIEFRILPREMSSSPRYVEHCRAQIVELLRLMRVIAGRVDAAGETWRLNDFPYPGIAELDEAVALWRKIVANTWCAFRLKKAGMRVAKSQLVARRRVVGWLASLLATAGVIPSNYVPFVVFDGLDVPLNVILHGDAVCQHFLVQALCLERRAAECYRTLSLVDGRFGNATEEWEGAVFRDIVASGDAGRMWEFLAHPGCMAVASVQALLQERNRTNFEQLVGDCAAFYCVPDKGAAGRLVAAAIGSRFAPPLRMRGIGKDWEELFAWMIETDPVQSLALAREFGFDALRGLVENMPSVEEWWRVFQVR